MENKQEMESLLSLASRDNRFQKHNVACACVVASMHVLFCVLFHVLLCVCVHCCVCVCVGNVCAVCALLHDVE